MNWRVLFGRGTQVPKDSELARSALQRSSDAAMANSEANELPVLATLPPTGSCAMLRHVQDQHQKAARQKVSRAIRVRANCEILDDGHFTLGSHAGATAQWYVYLHA